MTDYTQNIEYTSKGWPWLARYRYQSHITYSPQSVGCPQSAPFIHPAQLTTTIQLDGAPLLAHGEEACVRLPKLCLRIPVTYLFYTLGIANHTVWTSRICCLSSNLLLGSTEFPIHLKWHRTVLH